MGMGVCVAVGATVDVANDVCVEADVAVGVGFAWDNVHDVSKQINRSTDIFFIRLRFPNILLNDTESVCVPCVMRMLRREFPPMEACP